MQSKDKSAAEIQAERLILILEAAIKLNQRLIEQKKRERIAALLDISKQLN